MAVPPAPARVAPDASPEVSPRVAPEAESPPPSEPLPGVSAKGLPFSQRGGIVVDVAALRISAPSGGTSFVSTAEPLASIDLAVHVPVLPHTFIDGNIPIGLGAVGNPMVGVHHVFRVSDRWSINLGGAFGFPVVANQNFLAFTQTKAFWDAQDFLVETVPFAVRTGLEGHVGIVELRFQLEPVFGVDIGDAPTNGQRTEGSFVALQHAFELQIGHTIGGGIRYQGVVSSLDLNLSDLELQNTVSVTTDHYQGALEPFFRVYHDPIWFRLGLLLPLDSPLGTPFSTSWGARLAAGWNLD